MIEVSGVTHRFGAHHVLKLVFDSICGYAEAQI